MNIVLLLQIFFIIALFFTMLATTICAKTSGPQRYLSVATICGFIGMIGYYCELTAKSLSDAYRACKLEYVAYVIAPLMVLEFVSLYDKSKIITLIERMILVADIVILCLVWTSEKHTLYYKRIWIVNSGGNSYILVDPGPMYYIYTIVMIIWAICATYVAYRVYRKYRNNKTHEYFYLFMSIMIFIVGWIVAKFHLVGYYDLSAVDCVVALFSLTYVTFRYGLFDTISEARDMYINGMEEGILVTNISGRPIYGNPEMQKIFEDIDWTNNADIEENVIDFLHENENGFLKDGRYFSWRENSTHNSRGNCEGKVYYLFDISDTYNYTRQLLDMKDKAVKANQMKNSFISNISHEIRTPINSILGMNELITRENNDPEVTEYSYNIREAGKNLLSLANDILDMSRMEAGRIEIHNSKYDLAVLINDCLQMTSGRIEEKGIKFDACIAKDMPVSYIGDEIRLKQCITNFLTNAIKYTNEGYISLNVNGVRKSQSEYILCISVTDTGRGIREEDQEKLFSPFVRLEAEKSYNYNIEGSGLGLSLTKQMIDVMHGSISVNSIYGQGSTFSVEIPQLINDDTPIGNFRDHLSEVKKKDDRQDRRFITHGAKVLVVDDNEVNRLVVSGLLKKFKVHVDEAESGAKCLAMIKEKHYDIIFMDHMMPEMDGIVTLHMIKKLPEDMWRATSIIALTANAGADAKETYLNEGFDDYMMKPVDIDILNKMIEKYIPKDMLEYY